MKNYTDEELIEEIIERGLVKEVAEELDDDDVCQMVRDRDLEENFDESDFDEEEEREKLEIEVQTEWEANHHVLPKMFDRFQLRDHLVNITGLGSYVSDKKLFDKLSDLLEFS